MSFHTPPHKQQDPAKKGSVISLREEPKQSFMDWWREEGYKIHVTDSNSFAFASKVWAAAQANK